MRVTTLKQQGRAVQARRVAMGMIGDDSHLANSGRYRTANKRGLLGALNTVMKASGRVPPFKGKY